MTMRMIWHTGTMRAMVVDRSLDRALHHNKHKGPQDASPKVFIEGDIESLSNHNVSIIPSV